MEPVVKPSGRPRGRPRKRKREDEEDPKLGAEAKKQPVQTRPVVLVERYVLKEFEDNGIFLGKIVYYDRGLYRVDYEDGDCEDLESGELRQFLLEDTDFDDDLTRRRKKLDKVVLERSKKSKKESDKKTVQLGNAVDGDAIPSESEHNGGLTIQNGDLSVNGDTDFSGDSCDTRDGEVGMVGEAQLVPPPPSLPLSSGTIGVPEEYVSHLFSVYGMLRSFGIRLFLSPFGLDDLVGALNSAVRNNLLDAIHMSLMSALRRHLEELSSYGSELASRCLRRMDWSLLDALTWPVYVIHYLTVMGYMDEPEWKGFYDDVLCREYYSLPIGRKLMVLQILCDDVLEFAEIRAELNMREESEVGIDSDDAATSHHELLPRRVHPRYAKTSACMDTDAMRIIAESQGKTGMPGSRGFKGRETNSEDDNGSTDANGDECRLCGMDGTLLCCDGCPSAYHYRCIGVSKIHIPEGLWYCPECAINKSGLIIATGTSLRGAEIFGTDTYDQLFMGTCNHLLVLRTSINAEPFLRYYNQSDIPKVLQTLYSSVQHTILYTDICDRILKYWNISKDVLLPREVGSNLSSINEDTTFSTLSMCVDNCEVLNRADAEKGTASGSEGNVTESVLQRNHHVTTTEVTPKSLLEQIKVEPALPNGSVSQQVDPSILSRKDFDDRSGAINYATHTSRNSISDFNGHANGVYLLANKSIESKERNLSVLVGGERSSAADFTYMGLKFEPQAYINHYNHGDFAASAAANLAILSSEENRVSEAHAASDPRKAVSANIALQAKAFASAAIRFFWPSSEKKLVEVPRERCGWCFSCKVVSKRSCMLNSAASNAIKGALKFFSGLRYTISGDSVFPSIATYILYMEDSLSGLIVGPFLSASFRKQWKNQLEQASTCRTIKLLLLDFEENIRAVALSKDWIKLVDDWFVEPSVNQNGTCIIRTAQKCEPTGRRNSKHSAKSEITTECCDEKKFLWWRGGKLGNIINQKWILPSKMVKKAARQGGACKISGISYADGSEIPKISRRLIWRAAVEASKNASQLAFQVRNLDLHVRWSDLVRPEHTLPDGKGPDTEASAFRNAIICDKKYVENKSRYGVVFGTQKHLPSRVMKNIIETEKRQDGIDKYWFLEVHIPLYLIKEYERSIEDMLFPSTKKPLNILSKLQQLQLKASRRDIFSYLTRKRDNLDECACAFCQLNVLLRDAVKCNVCEGYCHLLCTESSTFSTNAEGEFLTTCKCCYHTKIILQKESNNECSTKLILRQAASNSKETTSNSIQDDSNSANKRRSPCNWGIIWKKKNCEDVEDKGSEFRRNNILVKDKSDMSMLRPVCRLCKKPYSSTLMYIRCETCEHWYHAVSVKLEESKLCDVVGFKCCKCRRILSPVCPFMDPSEKSEGKKKCKRRSTKELKPTTPVFPAEEVSIMDDKSRICCVKVEPIADQNIEGDFEWHTASVPGLQKLPVRRQIKQEGNFDCPFSNDISQTVLSSNLEDNDLWGPAGKPSSPRDGEGMFDYEGLGYVDMEFEPQTYFSLTELLDSEDGGQIGVNASDDVWGVQENLFSETLQDGVSEQEGKYFSTEEQDPIISVESTENITPCQMCSHVDPAPDLVCQSCGYVIHSYCSPWEESDIKDNWRCCQCREWR